MHGPLDVEAAIRRIGELTGEARLPQSREAQRDDLDLALLTMVSPAGSGMADPAKEVAKRILAVLQFDPRDPIFPRATAQVLWSEGHLDEAVETLESAAHFIPLEERADLLDQLAGYYDDIARHVVKPAHLLAADNSFATSAAAADAVLAKVAAGIEPPVTFFLSLIKLQQVAMLNGNPAAALDAGERIIKLIPAVFPTHEPMLDELYVSQGNLLALMGRTQAATTMLVEAFNRNPAVLDAVYFLARIPNVAERFSFEDVQFFEQNYYACHGDRQLRENWPNFDQKLINCAFGIGDIYSALGDDARALTWYQRGNELRRHHVVPFSISDLKESDILGPRAVYERLQRSAYRPTQEGVQPIFIVGTPRSGTSLLEKLLSSRCDPDTKQNDIFPGGELDLIRTIHSLLLHQGPGAEYDHQFLREVSAHAAEALERRIPGGARAHTKYVIDKQPANLLNLGVVQTFFPNSIILECVRDPVEAMLAMYVHNFASVNMSHATSLEDLAAYHTQIHEPARQYWRKHLPPGRIVSVAMEDLVADPEGTMAEVTRQAGLQWQSAGDRKTREYPSMTESRKVRGPICPATKSYSEKYPAEAAHLKQLLQGR